MDGCLNYTFNGNETQPELLALLPEIKVDQLVEAWLNEDIPPLDVGGAVIGQKTGTAKLFLKQSAVICGGEFFESIFHRKLGCEVEWLLRDGQAVHITECDREAKCNIVVAVVNGPIQNILLGERTALNIMCRASGIATLTRSCVEKAKRKLWRGKIAATRKTTPGFRLVEKYAVLVGGGDTHRYDLSSMVMLKDNHIQACDGDIELAVKRAKRLAGFSQKIEVEARTHEEAVKACQAGAHIVMLDNFKPKIAKEVADKLKTKFPFVLIEASGGIGPDNLEEYFADSIDIISMSALTQGYPVIDFSLKIVN